MVIKNTKNNKKTIILIVIVLLLVAVGTAVYMLFWSKQGEPSKANDNSFGKVNYDPPTQEDKDYNDRIKENLGNQQQDNTPSAAKKKASITIVDASQYGTNVEVRAFAAGITESEGSCTFTFTNGDSQVVRKTAARAEAQTTPCTNLSIEKSAFSPAGNWSLVVSYDSATSTGKSEERTVEIR